MKAKERCAGFTLMELLVVVLIIGILIGIIFGATSYVMDNQARKRAKVDVELLRASVVDYKTRYGDYPNCPEGICTQGECLFLSLAGFHNEKGGLQIPPFKPTLNPNLIEYELLNFDPATVPKASHGDKQALLVWFAQVLGKDVAFRDPWGNEYVYEFPREDGGPGARIYSLGPDGEEGEEGDADNIE